MNSRLEQFVRDHREEFDTEEPDAKVWDAIQQDMKFVDPTKKKQAPVVRFYRTRWSVAAAVILLIAGTTWYFSTRQNGNNLPAVAAGNTNSAAQHPTQPSTQATKPAQVQPADSTRTKTFDAHSLATAGSNDNGSNTNVAATGDTRTDSHNSPEMNAEMNEEMYHYAKIVEIKHKELKTIEKDEPLLYRQFSSDVSKLDSVYHGLQHELPKNPNKEQIIEAMIQNLQLQMELLNHQLDIIKQINHSKKTAYDKAYKTA
jgi:multidrug efflux pump subunit AcrB